MKSKGFTLIELLVVIFIIGLLASIVVVGVNEARKKARDAKRMADLKAVQTALELYNDEFGNYPMEGDGINCECVGCLPGALGTSRIQWWKSTEENPWVPDISEFLPVVPVDPINQKGPGDYDDFIYAYASVGGTDYKLIEYNMESAAGKEKAKNDGGLVGAWGDPKYELFSPGAQWYKSCSTDVSTCGSCTYYP